MRITFIGGGVMAEAMLAAIINRGLATADAVAVGEPRAERRDHLAATYGVATTADNTAVIDGADVCVLATKPQDVGSVAAELAGRFRAGQLVLSIAAGIRLDTLTSSLRCGAVVRAMPNTPAQIGAGITVWTATPEVNAAQRDQTRQILQTMGKEIYVAEEKLVEMATAVSASGPAYVFLAMEALADAGVHIGLQRDVAWQLALQTFLGSAKLAEATGQHPALLRNMVTSPGGTTAAGLLRLEEGGVRARFIEAVAAAYRRSLELGS